MIVRLSWRYSVILDKTHTCKIQHKLYWAFFFLTQQTSCLFGASQPRRLSIYRRTSFKTGMHIWFSFMGNGFYLAGISFVSINFLPEQKVVNAPQGNGEVQIGLCFGWCSSVASRRVFSVPDLSSAQPKLVKLYFPFRGAKPLQSFLDLPAEILVLFLNCDTFFFLTTSKYKLRTFTW